MPPHHHGGDLHPIGVGFCDCCWGGRRWVTVRDHNDLTHGGRGFSQPSNRQFHRGIKIGHVAVGQRGRRGKRSFAIAHPLHGQNPNASGIFVISTESIPVEFNHAHTVARMKRLDRRFRHPPPPIVAFGHLARVHHHGNSTPGQLFGLGRLAIQREDIGQFTAQPPPCPKGPVATNSEQPHPKLSHRARQRGVLGIGKRPTWDIGQNHQVESRE